jgi:hypothetical protein
LGSHLPVDNNEFDEPSMGGDAIRENLQFAKASIKKTKTAKRFAMAGITFLDGSTPGIGRGSPDGLELASG